MEQKEIKEGNELITEFMQSIVPYSSEDAKYNEDWNWIMQVIDKIEEIGYSSIIGSGEHTWTSIFKIDKGLLHRREDLFTIQGNSKIENTWKACVEFIKWYNKNK